MHPAHVHALSQTDLLELNAFLHSPACGDEAMSLSRAHGFLTAAASGPEQLEPAEWLRLVFDEPVFEKQPGEFRPVLDFIRDGSGETRMDASAWCQGYFSGMSLCREQWALQGRGVLNGLLEPIFQLLRSADSPGGALHLQLCGGLAATAEAVYRYWRKLETVDAS
ncbi:MAG: YecA family protein [Thiobacillaceae bacterium]|nr:YecA family protein [Thiobacillaceae bacterium]